MVRSKCLFVRFAGVLIFVALLFSACSTKKNTAGARFYHSFAARYNTLHNGQQAFRTGWEAQQKGHKENYTSTLPVYIAQTKSTQSIGKGNYSTAIEKCEKAIKLHSIKKRPVTKGNKRLSPKEKAFNSRKEFNPVLYKAWFLMAESQFNRGEFIEAASTYHYMLRLYSTQPEITGIVRARLARCYVALEWPYDAEDVLSKTKRDSLTHRAQMEQQKSYAAYYIATQQYDKAIPCMESALKVTKGKQAKARLHFLMGQLYRETGNEQKAYKEWGRVIRSNPPYEQIFNARIAQTEVLSSGSNKQMIAKLKRMAKNEKNKNYLDQVYHAIGNIYLHEEDTTHCIAAWEKGVKDGVQNGIPKSILLLRLSQLYWDMENYIDAARTYKACASILDKEHDEYIETNRRSKILTELEPHLSSIHLQDSLQELAQMDSLPRIEAVDRLIEALKKHEKEEEKLLAKANTNQQDQKQKEKKEKQEKAADNSSSDDGGWYFYNPKALEAGEKDFRKRWGKRENRDFWRWSNKSNLPAVEWTDDAIIDSLENDSAHQQIILEKKLSKKKKGKKELLTDSTEIHVPTEEEIKAAEQARFDSLAADPHNREYYLKDIPFTEDKLKASNEVLAGALYNAGILEQERLENFPLAEETMMRLITNFPEYKDMDNIYYHLFLLYGRLGRSEEADQYKERLLTDFPESRYSRIIGNPNYEDIARGGKHMEDSLYAATYQAYKAEDFGQVGMNYEWSIENFPEGKHRAKLMFVHAMSLLYSGQRDSFLVVLREVVQKYPKDEVSAMAGSIVKGIDAGRIISDGYYDVSDLWGRRYRPQGAEGTEAPTLKEERYSNFAFVLAYPTKSLDEDKLLFEMARYNFTNYMVRNFDIEIQENQGLTFMVIKGFLSYDEVHSYAQNLYADEHMNTLLDGMRTLLISEENLPLIGREFSFDEYKEFYNEKFAPLNVPEDLIIDEPTELEIIDPDEISTEEPATEENNSSTTTTDDDDDFPFGL